MTEDTFLLLNGMIVDSIPTAGKQVRRYETQSNDFDQPTRNVPGVDSQTGFSIAVALFLGCRRRTGTIRIPTGRNGKPSRDAS